MKMKIKTKIKMEKPNDEEKMNFIKQTGRINL